MGYGHLRMCISLGRWSWSCSGRILRGVCGARGGRGEMLFAGYEKREDRGEEQL